MVCVGAENDVLHMNNDDVHCFFFLMIRRPPRSTQSRSSAASDVYKRQHGAFSAVEEVLDSCGAGRPFANFAVAEDDHAVDDLSLIHISEPTRPY